MRRAALVAAIVLAAACRRPPAPPTSPEAAALAAFTAAGASLVPGDDAGARVALRRLGDARDPRIRGTAPLPEGAVAVDVDASLGGGARGRFAIHVAPREDGTWRVVAIGGPGIAWPVPPPSPSEGLSESAPPR